MFTPSPKMSPSLAMMSPTLMPMRNDIRRCSGSSALRVGDLLLHPHGAAHRVHDTGELGQHAVAGGVGDPAAEGHDQLVDRRPVRRERGQRCFLVLGHQAAVAFDVGREDRDQPAIEAWCFHQFDPPKERS